MSKPSAWKHNVLLGVGRMRGSQWHVYDTHVGWNHAVVTCRLQVCILMCTQDYTWADLSFGHQQRTFWLLRRARTPSFIPVFSQAISTNFASYQSHSSSILQVWRASWGTDNTAADTARPHHPTPEFKFCQPLICSCPQVLSSPDLRGMGSR